MYLFGYKSGAFMPINTMQSLYNTMLGDYRKGLHYKPIVL